MTPHTDGRGHSSARRPQDWAPHKREGSSPSVIHEDALRDFNARAANSAPTTQPGLHTYLGCASASPYQDKPGWHEPSWHETAGAQRSLALGDPHAEFARSLGLCASPSISLAPYAPYASPSMGHAAPAMHGHVGQTGFIHMEADSTATMQHLVMHQQAVQQEQMRHLRRHEMLQPQDQQLVEQPQPGHATPHLEMGRQPALNQSAAQRTAPGLPADVAGLYSSFIQMHPSSVAGPAGILPQGLYGMLPMMGAGAVQPSDSAMLASNRMPSLLYDPVAQCAHPSAFLSAPMVQQPSGILGQMQHVRAAQVGDVNVGVRDQLQQLHGATAVYGSPLHLHAVEGVLQPHTPRTSSFDSAGSFDNSAYSAAYLASPMAMSSFGLAHPSPLAQQHQGMPTLSVDGGSLSLQPQQPHLADIACEPTLLSNEPNGGYMPLNPNYPGLRRIHESPPIYICDNFLSDLECDALINVARPLLQRSKTHAVAGPEATRGRTSLTCHLAKTTPPCPQLLRKVQLLTGKPYGHMELPQVARYTDGQRYVEHYDGVDPHCAAGKAFCASGGQRIATVLIYLNDVPEGGGGTFFRRLNLEVKPKRGNAVIFFPGFMNGELDLEALHAGLPPVGTKWVSQVWIRQSFREDGQPSAPVPESEQALIGPLHEGVYRGHCLAGDDVHEAIMTFEEAKAWAAVHPEVEGFTYKSVERRPDRPTHVWFKSRMRVLYNEEWWSYSLGKSS